MKFYLLPNPYNQNSKLLAIIFNNEFYTSFLTSVAYFDESEIKNFILSVNSVTTTLECKDVDKKRLQSLTLKQSYESTDSNFILFDFHNQAIKVNLV